MLSLALTLWGGACRADALGEAVVVVGGEDSRIAIVDGTTGQVLSHPGRFGRSARAALSPDRSVLYVQHLSDRANELAALDPRTGRVRWRRALTMPGKESATLVGGFELYGSAFAESPDGARLVFSHAIRPEDHGRVFEAARIAALDLTDRRHRLVATVGPLWVYPEGLATLPRGPAAPRGAVLAIGARRRGIAPSLDWLYVIDPTTLTVTDSAAVTPPSPHDGGTLSAVLAGPDGRHVYLQAHGGELVAYDLVTRTVTGRASAPAGAALALSRDGRGLYAAARQTGEVFAFDAVGAGRALVPRDTIDLSATAADAGRPPRINGIAVSQDGARLYLAAGTASAGFDAIQRQRLLVVDVATRALLRAVPLGQFGAASVHVP